MCQEAYALRVPLGKSRTAHEFFIRHYAAAIKEWQNPGDPDLFNYHFDPKDFEKQYPEILLRLSEVFDERYGGSYKDEELQHFLRYLGCTKIFTDTYKADYISVLNALIGGYDELLFEMLKVAAYDHKLRFRNSYTYFLRYPEEIEYFKKNMQDILEEKRKTGKRKVTILIPGCAFGEEIVSWKHILDTQIKPTVPDFDEFNFEFIGVEKDEDVCLQAELNLKYGFKVFSLGTDSPFPLSEEEKKQAISNRLDLMLQVNRNLGEYSKSIEIVLGDISSKESKALFVNSDLVIMSNIMYQMGNREISDLFEHVSSAFEFRGLIRIIGEEGLRFKELKTSL